MKYAINTCGKTAGKSVNADFTWQHSMKGEAIDYVELANYISDGGKGVVVWKKGGSYAVYFGGMTLLGETKLGFDRSGLCYPGDRQMRWSLIVSDISYIKLEGLVCYFLEHWDNPGKKFDGTIVWKDDDHWEAQWKRIDEIVKNEIPGGRDKQAHYTFQRFGPCDEITRGIVRGELLHYFDLTGEDGIKLVIEDGITPQKYANNIREQADVYLAEGVGATIKPKKEKKPEKKTLPKRFNPIKWLSDRKGLFVVLMISFVLSVGIGYSVCDRTKVKKCNDKITLLSDKVNKLQNDYDKLKGNYDNLQNDYDNLQKTSQGGLNAYLIRELPTIKKYVDLSDAIKKINKRMDELQQSSNEHSNHQDPPQTLNHKENEK